MTVLDTLLGVPPEKIEEAAIQHVRGYTYRRDGDTIHVESYTRESPVSLISSLVQSLEPYGPGTGAKQVVLPDGITIRRESFAGGRHYTIEGTGDGTPADAGTPREAAKIAANRSARSTAPESFGGSKSYPGVVSAAAATEGPPGELGGGIAKPVEGDKPRGAEGVRAATKGLAEPDTSSEKPKPGGWMKIKIGEGPGTAPGRGRVITATVSKNVFEFHPALIDRGLDIPEGARVRITKLHGAPAPGTMGHYHVADVDTGKLLGMVAYGSLRKVGRDKTGQDASLRSQFSKRDKAVARRALRNP